MEKDLFYILQELKVDINTLNLKSLKEKLEKINFYCMYEEDNFNYYNKKFFLNNLKFLLTRFLMLGMCTKNQLDAYRCRRESLERNLDLIEDKYNLLLRESVILEILIEINENREQPLKNNFKQIDSFLEFIKPLSEEEKDKIFSYKMGANNG